MATAATVSLSAADSLGEVSVVRLYVLRATYLLLVVGLGATVVPVLFSHEPMARGVIPGLSALSGCLRSSACAIRCRCFRCCCSSSCGRRSGCRRIGDGGRRAAECARSTHSKASRAKSSTPALIQRSLP